MLRQLIDRVTSAIDSSNTDSSDADRETALRMATTVLMIDVACADHVFDDSEFDRVLELVESHFGVTGIEAAELVDVAAGKAEELTSAFEFTQVLHKHLDDTEKARIVALLWQVAFADGRLDKYEDSLVLKISDLLHVSRGLVMRLKHDAAQQTS